MDCQHIPVTGYADFSKRLHNRCGGRNIPLTGSIEVTARCNLRCAHCYINLPAGDRDARERELSSREICNLLDQIVDEGCLWLLMTGGESFIRPDFTDIYTYAKKKGLLVTIFTNGTTITPAIADHLAEWQPFVLEISLYGQTQETYERVTGIPGSYDACMRGIDLLMERNLPLKLKAMVLTLNKHEIWEMKAFAEGLGLDFRFDPVLNLRTDGGRSTAELRIPAQEAVALDLADEKRLEGWREFCDRFLGAPSRPEFLYQCGAGVETFHIDPYGRMSACMMARVPTHDLRDGTFHDGWQNLMPRVRMQRRTRKTPCENCELISLCGQCPGWALMENGDQETPVEYLCQIAHLRATAFGFKNKTGGNDEKNNRNREEQAAV